MGAAILALTTYILLRLGAGEFFLYLAILGVAVWAKSLH